MIVYLNINEVVVINTAPHFLTSSQATTVTIDLNNDDPSYYTLPVIIDDEQDTYTVTISSLESFMSVQDNSIINFDKNEA